MDSIIVVTYVDFICLGFNDLDAAYFMASYITGRLDDRPGTESADSDAR